MEEETSLQIIGGSLLESPNCLGVKVKPCGWLLVSGGKQHVNHFCLLCLILLGSNSISFKPQTIWQKPALVMPVLKK